MSPTTNTSHTFTIYIYIQAYIQIEIVITVCHFYYNWILFGPTKRLTRAHTQRRAEDPPPSTLTDGHILPETRQQCVQVQVPFTLSVSRKMFLPRNGTHQSDDTNLSHRCREAYIIWPSYSCHASRYRRRRHGVRWSARAADYTSLFPVPSSSDFVIHALLRSFTSRDDYEKTLQIQLRAMLLLRGRIANCLSAVY